MNIAKLLENSGRSFADSRAVCLGRSNVHSYSELCARTQRIAASFNARFGLTLGERVAILMTNDPAYLESLFAAWWAGMIAVPINARLHSKEVEYILQKSKARLCLVNDDTERSVTSLGQSLPELKEVINVSRRPYQLLAETKPLTSPVHRLPSDPAWLFFTSGTTGRPKAATLTHLNLLVMSLTYLADIQQATPLHAIFHAAPLSHGTGLLALPHVAKASVNVLMESKSMDHQEIFDLLDAYSKVTMYHTPTMVKRMVNHPSLSEAALGNLDTVFYGGSPMYLADLQHAIKMLGPRMIQMWAQAETPNTGTYLSKADHMGVANPRYLDRISSAGIPRTGVEVMIVDDHDRPVPVGEPGEVVVRGDVVMAGYWEDPETNAQTLRGGWLHTGDIGALDQDGYLTIKDRTKDMIISGGFNIYPREIEEVLLCHPDVLEASVIGLPHADYVEQVVACVVRRPGSTVSDRELDSHCLANIARFKRPRAYFWLDELPKGYYGKVEKRQLRERVALQHPSAVA
jgi:long-chain acyl-CoA synthetase